MNRLNLELQEMYLSSLDGVWNERSPALADPEDISKLSQAIGQPSLTQIVFKSGYIMTVSGEMSVIAERIHAALQSRDS